MEKFKETMELKRNLVIKEIQDETNKGIEYTSPRHKLNYLLGKVGAFNEVIGLVGWMENLQQVYDRIDKSCQALTFMSLSIAFTEGAKRHMDGVEVVYLEIVEELNKKYGVGKE